MLTKLLQWIRREIVLVISSLLAMGSAVFVHPDGAYLSYIDFRTLALLFCLMGIMAGLNRIGVFVHLAHSLLKHVRSLRGLYMMLCGMCFFTAMVITNDVALITFIPFTLVVLRLIGGSKRQIFLIVCETVAANLGSMLTTIGNPQNLYLYAAFSMTALSFFKTMLPYAALALFLLCVSALFMPKQNCVSSAEKTKFHCNASLFCYLGLFLLTLFCVARILPYWVPFAAVSLYMLIADRPSLKKVDYSLLCTFVFLFIFIGNLGRIETVSAFLHRVIDGRETLVAVLCSQVFSNVPTAILLSRFTDKAADLLVGVNLGGLGTLIASMASLISFKYISKEGWNTGKYLLVFTGLNIIYLAPELALYRILGA